MPKEALACLNSIVQTTRDYEHKEETGVHSKGKGSQDKTVRRGPWGDCLVQSPALSGGTTK